jgi:CRISPR-associated endonuclease/helicase Cas3
MPRTPPRNTRYIDTALGVLTYSQLAPHLAERVAIVEDEIRRRDFASAALDELLILELHRRVVGELIPRMAGRWRTHDVIVGSLEPPAFNQVPVLMREYGLDLKTRIDHLPDSIDERLLQLLAFAEHRLLYIHPFEDFNGRVTRLFLAELLYRLTLPIVNTASEPGPELDTYLAALRAADDRDLQPLIDVWRQRFEKEDLSGGSDA